MLPDATAAFVRFSPVRMEESEEVLPCIVFDCDNQGRILGMEVLDAREPLLPDLLSKAASVSCSHPASRLRWAKSRAPCRR